MRKKALRSLTLLTLLAAAFSVTAWAVSVVQEQVGSQQPQDRSSTKRKTLREIAQEQDIEFDMREGHFDKEYSDLRWLAKHSDAIVLGRILEEETYFSGDNDITTKYKVDVHRIIKDGTSAAALLSQSLGRDVPVPLTTPLRFTRFGGTVHVNGHRASLRVKGSELLTSGKTYILFLQWTGRNYHIAGGISGAVLVEDNHRVKPLGSEKGMLEFNDTHLEILVSELLIAQ
jgi:hypothetical protein